MISSLNNILPAQKWLGKDFVHTFFIKKHWTFLSNYGLK